MNFTSRSNTITYKSTRKKLIDVYGTHFGIKKLTKMCLMQFYGITEENRKVFYYIQISG